ncbi:MAG: alpha/beta hydrolase [Spirochaetaceae bacterium]|jgi:acetyl esterase/lipase|nr:alpha/beta hydrolase [Spirochaetaceae bacterium]
MSKPDFVPTTFRPDRKKAVKKLQTLAFGPKDSPAEFREKLKKALYTPFIPNRVACKTRTSGGIAYDELVPQVFIEGRVIFYIHGGAFVAGTYECWRPFTACLANACSARLFIPNYRPAPSYAFPSALEDIQNVFAEIHAAETVSAAVGGAPFELIIAADGSGASPALALIHSMKERIRREIRQILLFSPWLDLSPEALVFAKKKNADEVLSAEGMRASAELYTYSANMHNPLVSPLCSPPEEYRGFPPVYIQLGEREIILPDVQRFCAVLEAQSVPCTLDAAPDMMHMFQMADEFLEESSLAVERAGRAVKARCEPPGDSPEVFFQ